MIRENQNYFTHGPQGGRALFFADHTSAPRPTQRRSAMSPTDQDIEKMFETFDKTLDEVLTRAKKLHEEFERLNNILEKSRERK